MSDPTILVPPWLASVLDATGHQLPPTMAVDLDEEDEDQCACSVKERLSGHRIDCPFGTWACEACGNEMPPGRRRCAAIECGGGSIPALSEAVTARPKIEADDARLGALLRPIVEQISDGLALAEAFGRRPRREEMAGAIRRLVDAARVP